ncbi:MAG: pseudaminic acid cytidylyltransferase [Bacteroidales bacterium]|nr:pseudaminic acid cytidylyltransferase [Bacteroidales bacterium]
MSNLCIIPARSGSKRIPGKNIKPFCGRPIISYSIEAALESGLFDEVMVSTDSEEVAEVARAYDANVPFFRSEKTSNDYATIADVIREVVNRYQEQGRIFEGVCCLLATAPLVTSDSLREAYEKLMSSPSLSTVYPVVKFGYPVQRCLQIDQNGVVDMKWPEYRTSRSQDLEPLYHDSGTFYWHKTNQWMSGNIVRGAIVVDENLVQDIDTETDWLLAEMKYKMLFPNTKSTE